MNNEIIDKRGNYFKTIKHTYGLHINRSNFKMEMSDS